MLPFARCLLASATLSFSSRGKRETERKSGSFSLTHTHTHTVYTRNCLLGLLVTRRTRREHGINVKTPGILLLVSWRFPALLPRFPGIVTLKPVTFSGSNPATRSRALGAALCHATLAKCSSSRATATRIRELHARAARSVQPLDHPAAMRAVHQRARASLLATMHEGRARLRRTPEPSKRAHDGLQGDLPA